MTTCTCMNHSSVSNGDRQPPAEFLFRAEVFPISTRRVTRLATVNGRLCPTITICWSEPESEFRVPDRARVSSLWSVKHQNNARHDGANGWTLRSRRRGEGPTRTTDGPTALHLVQFCSRFVNSSVLSPIIESSSSVAFSTHQLPPWPCRS